MVSGYLALLYFLLGFHGGRQGSGSDRGQSPVEWGDFPSVHSSVRPFPPLGLAGWLAGPQAWLDGPEGGTDGRTNIQKISRFCRTLSPIGAAALPLP